jgi:hypothetical protein
MPTCGCQTDTFKKAVKGLNLIDAIVVIAVGILRFFLPTVPGQAPVVDYALSVYFM